MLLAIIFLHFVVNRRIDVLLSWQCFMILHYSILCFHSPVECFLDHLGLQLFICSNLHMICIWVFLGDDLMTPFDWMFAFTNCPTSYKWTRTSDVDMVFMPTKEDQHLLKVTIMYLHGNFVTHRTKQILAIE